MKNRIKRAKRLLQVQSRLLLTERLELQSLRDELAQAQDDEQKAIALLNQESPVPPALLVRRAASAAIKARNSEALLEMQVERTLDHARREQLVKKKLESETRTQSQNEMKMALQAAIDAYLSSRLKQDE